MAKRIYISPILQLGGEDGNVPAVRRDGDAIRPTRAGTVETLMAIGPDGHPTVPWCLVFADFVDQAAALSVPGVFAMPEVSYDAKVSTMSGATATAMFNAFSERGIPLDIAPSERAYRRVVRALGQMLEPAFDETLGGYAL